MRNFDPQLNEAFAWFATNWDKWKTLNTTLTDSLGFVLDSVVGPSRPSNEPHWQWIRDNRDDLLALYNSIKED